MTLRTFLSVVAICGLTPLPLAAQSTLAVELYPFVSTSFVEVVPDDFSNPASPLFGETQDQFLERIETTPPFVLPVIDPQTGEILAETGGNSQGEPVYVEMDGRLFVRVGALSENDSLSVPFRFNGLIDNQAARDDLEYFFERELLGGCGRPHAEFPLRYARSDLTPPEDYLTTLTGLDIDGDPTNCSFVDDPDTHEDETVACDAENIPGPDSGADITREDWLPRQALESVTLGRWLEGGGTLRVSGSGDVGRGLVRAKGLLSGELYTFWEIDTDPLGRPLPQGFPMGGAPHNLAVIDHSERLRWETELIHNPVSAEIIDAPPPLPPLPIPVEATIGIVVVWHTNAETNGGLDFSTHSGGGLEGG